MVFPASSKEVTQYTVGSAGYRVVGVIRSWIENSRINVERERKDRGGILDRDGLYVPHLCLVADQQHGQDYRAQ